MIVIPMAGLSSRFRKAGYERPKYMLPVEGVSLFDHALLSFRAALDTTPFLIIYRDIDGTAAFLAERVVALGLRTVSLVRLDAPTRGQAETVALGLKRASVAPDTPITIFNIDTIRPCLDLSSLSPTATSSGALEVFEGSGDNWSFVLPDPAEPRRVMKTSEKVPISRLCCTGLYHFARASDFLTAFAAAESDVELQGPNGEIYVAPLYNHLIANGLEVDYSVIEPSAVIFSGVPSEYEALLKAPERLREPRR